MKRLAVAVASALALALVGTVAVAAWLSSGTGAGAAAASSLAKPTAVAGSQTAGTGTVHVTWTASAGTLAPTGYYVLRTPSSGTAQAACGTSPASPVSGTSCSDASVAVGTYTYTVVAVFHSWTSTSASSGQVTVGKADQSITFTTSPTSPTFGGTYTVSATGGASGNPVTFASTTTSVCTVSGTTVSFVHAGSCTITANQAGSTYYNSAPQVSQTFQVAKAAQTITFTTAAPSNAVVGGSGYTPAAAGGGSGNPVTFAIDPLASGICTIAGGVVTYQHVGTCVVDAGQAGNVDYADAPTAQQSIAVGKGAQAINFTSTVPTSARVGGPTYTVTATGGASGNPVVFTSASTSVCTVSGSTVSFVGTGTCTINANQAGSADYLAATQVQQSFAVASGDTTAPTFTSVDPPAGASYVGSANGSNSWPTSGCGGGRICATVTDGGTGVSSVTYQLTTGSLCWNGNAFVTGPCQANTMTLTSGSAASGTWQGALIPMAQIQNGTTRTYNLVITATDGASNTKTSTTTFSGK